MLKHIPSTPLGGPLGGGPLGGVHLGGVHLGGVPLGAGVGPGAMGSVRDTSLPLSPRTLSPPSLSRSLHSHLSTASGSPAGASPANHSPANHSPAGGGHGHPPRHGHRPTPIANGGLHISRISAISSPSGLHPMVAGPGPGPTCGSGSGSGGGLAGVQEALGSLGLVCVSALLLALLALLALLQLAGPPPLDLGAPDEYVLVHEAALALCALALSLDLSCLLVCAVQFLFAVKLARSPHAASRTDKYLRKSASTRVCAMGGFFVSIPVFLTGIILYTFIQFHSTPAIVTSVLIGVGIIFCGCAMVHNVFVWQKEKTNAVRQLTRQHHEEQRRQSLRNQSQSQQQHWMTDIAKHTGNGSIGLGLSPAVPHATLDLSSVTTTPHELSTLV